MNTPKKGNLYILLYIFYQIIASVAIVFIGTLFTDDINSGFYTSPLTLLATQLLSFIPPFLLCLFLTKDRVSRLLPVKKPTLRNIVLIILMCVLVQPFMMLLSAVSAMLFPNNIEAVMTGMSSYPFLMTLTAAAVIPAICEEATFRGLLLTSYKNIKIKKAALINGLFFGIVHMDPQQFLYAFALGVAFAYIVFYTGSIFYSILAHFIINGIQTVLLYLSFFADAAESTPVITPQEQLYAYALLFIICAVCLPALIALFKRFVKHNKADGNTPHEDIISAEQPSVFNWSFWCIVICYIVWSVLGFF